MKNRLHDSRSLEEYLEIFDAFYAENITAWPLLRRWRGSRVVCECHYDHHQAGRPLTFEDLRFAGLEARP